MPDSVELDWKKTFPHLANPPIVEAVLYWQARAEKSWDAKELREELSKRLPQYSKTKSQHVFEIGLEASTTQVSPSPKTSQEFRWHGFRISDGLHIAQFNRNGLSFSRLRPYQDWKTFEAESRRLWRVFIDLAAPSQVQRLGVRFINKILVSSVESLQEYLRDPPTCPVSLPLKGFLYQSTFDVPNTNLGVKVVKTLQPLPATVAAASALILDIGVFTKQPMQCDDDVLDEQLPKLHWLKNAVFFGLLTDEAIPTFQKG